MNIKMIATDLDGTLLRDDKSISERTLSALMRCRERGIKTVYATGRDKSATQLVAFEYFDGVVRNNGASAYFGDTLLYSRPMPIESIRELLIACDRAGYKVAAERNGVHYANFTPPDEWSVPSKKVDFSEHTLDAEKVYIIVDSPEVVTSVRRYISGGLYLCVTRDDFVMVMHKEATKSSAISALAKHWGILQSEIVSFGDDINDIDLLRYSGIGVAMGNALPDVKAVANQICDTNENDGVAKWLEANLR